MIFHKDNIVLFGGLGCEKNLTWANLDLQT